jgi:hypothetical protein
MLLVLITVSASLPHDSPSSVEQDWQPSDSEEPPVSGFRHSGVKCGRKSAKVRCIFALALPTDLCARNSLC